MDPTNPFTTAKILSRSFLVNCLENVSAVLKEKTRLNRTDLVDIGLEKSRPRYIYIPYIYIFFLVKPAGISGGETINHGPPKSGLHSTDFFRFDSQLYLEPKYYSTLREGTAQCLRCSAPSVSVFLLFWTQKYPDDDDDGALTLFHFHEIQPVGGKKRKKRPAGRKTNHKIRTTVVRTGTAVGKETVLRAVVYHPVSTCILANHPVSANQPYLPTVSTCKPSRIYLQTVSTCNSTLP